jgi:ubiquinol-cytochrome c reductase cytochrome b subunit
MMARIAWLFMGLGLGLAVWGGAVPAQELSAQDLVRRLECRACHSLDGKGGGRAPAWDKVGARLTPEAISKQLTHPKSRMPSFAHLRPQELQALVDYLSHLK